MTEEIKTEEAIKPIRTPKLGDDIYWFPYGGREPVVAKVIQHVNTREGLSVGLTAFIPMQKYLHCVESCCHRSDPRLKEFPTIATSNGCWEWPDDYNNRSEIEAREKEALREKKRLEASERARVEKERADELVALREKNARLEQQNAQLKTSQAQGAKQPQPPQQQGQPQNQTEGNLNI